MLANILALGQPETWQTSLRLAGQGLAGFEKPARPFQRVYFIGHGSSLYNGLVGKTILEHIAGIPAEAIPAFSFERYTEPALLGPQTLVVGISTTGSTQAACDALAFARQSGSPTLAITAHAGSPITHPAGLTLLTGGEDDQFSVKTKSYVQALIPLYLLALHLRGELLHLHGEALHKAHWLDQIQQAAEGARRFLQEQRAQVQALARQYAQAPKVFVFGSGPNLGTAEEASLKVIEMAKIYSECQELEDFFHGRLREVDPTSPLFFIAPSGRSSRRILDFLTVAQRINAPTIVLTDEVTPAIQSLATHILPIPARLDEYATPLLYILPLYLFSYELALQRGFDPDARRYDFVPQNVRWDG